MGLLAVLVAGVSAAPNPTDTGGEEEPERAILTGKPQAKIRRRCFDMPLIRTQPGQTDAKVKFLTRAQNFTVLLTPGEIVLRGRNADVLRMKLQNGNQSPRVVGENRQLKVSNYYIGNDRSKWLEGVPNFGQVRYRDVYSGIVMIYHMISASWRHFVVFLPAPTRSEASKAPARSISQKKTQEDRPPAPA